MKKFCVYALLRKDNDDIFYIGKGLKARAFESRNRNMHCTRVMNKHGYYVKIFKWFDLESDAFAFEIEKIKEIGLHNLTNITTGGEGATGRVPSSISRAKCSLSNKGTKPSEHTLKRASEVNSKKVCNEYGMVFDSLTDAATYVRETTSFKNASKSAISAACNGYRVDKAYGIRWNFIEDGIIIENGFISSPVKTRKVKNDKNDKFNSIAEAINFLKNNGHPLAQSINIIQSCKKQHRNAYGYKWEYIDDSK